MYSLQIWFIINGLKLDFLQDRFELFAFHRENWVTLAFVCLLINVGQNKAISPPETDLILRLRRTRGKFFRT